MPRTPTNPYVPQGRMIPLLAALEAQPDRTFTGYEAAQIIGGDVRQMASYVFYAERAGRVFKRVVGKGKARRLELRATPFPDEPEPVKPSQDLARQRWKEGGSVPSLGWSPEDDPRVLRVVPGWKPPVMRHVRGGQ